MKKLFKIVYVRSTFKSLGGKYANLYGYLMR